MTASEVVRVTDGEGGVLNWHVEAAEGDHFGAMREVEVVETGFPEVIVSWS